MQPLQYHLRCPAAKENSITHAAAVPSNLDAAITNCNHHVANLHVSTHITTPEHQMTTVMQPFQCDLQPEIPKHPTTMHTQAHPKQLEATVTLRQKTRCSPRTRMLTRITDVKTHGFVLRLPPQYIAHATSCSHYNAVRSINSQTCTYLRTEQHQNTK